MLSKSIKIKHFNLLVLEYTRGVERMTGVRKREVKVREVLGRKIVNNKEYKYTYYTLPLNIYIPKHIVEKMGRDYILEINSETGEIKAYPKKLKEAEASEKSEE